jgi:hypothetical protein
MEGKNILDLPDDILFVVLLFVAYVPRDILTCYQVCKTFQSFLDNVDGSFWRRAFMAAYAPCTYGWSANTHLEITLWRKGTYADPIRCFVNAQKGRGPPFVEPTPVPAFPGCLPPYYLNNGLRKAKEGETTIFDQLRLGDTAIQEWRPLFKDFFCLFRASLINRAFTAGHDVISLQDLELRYWTLSAFPGPFQWLRSAPSPVPVDLLRLNIKEILKSVPIPDLLHEEYEVVPVSNKRDFSYVIFQLLFERFGASRTQSPKSPFRVNKARSVEISENGDDEEERPILEFDVIPGDAEGSVVSMGFPENAYFEPVRLDLCLSKLYNLFVLRLGSCFIIRPRAECEHETFLVRSLPLLFVSARPKSGRLIGLYNLHSN